MNTRMLGGFVIAAAAASSAQARAELPSHWVDQQIKCANQEQLAQVSTAADARAAAVSAAAPAAAARPGAIVAAAKPTVVQK